MSEGRIATARDGAIATVTIDNEARRNTLTAQMRLDLADALGALDGDPRVRVIVITGAGDRAFVSGGDVRELGERTLEEQRAVMANGSVFGAVRRVRTPIVAAINGLCLGGGLEIALGCDIRIAANHARLGQPEVALGLIPGGGGTQMLPRVVGQAQALRLVLTGEAIDAYEALRIGLVHEVVDRERVMERARDVASVIASRSPNAVRAAKAATRAALDLPFEEGRQFELRLFEECFERTDRREGVSAFLEKRPPRFNDA